MKLVLTILVAVFAAFAARSLASSSDLRAQGASPGVPRDEAELGALRVALEELREGNRRLAAEIERRQGALVAAPAAGPDQIGEAEIGAALERWRAANPEEARAAAAGRRKTPARISADELDLANIPMSELVLALSGEGLTHPARQELFQKLRDLGRIDEYVAAIEKLAADDPDDADLQVALGHAYLQKLFGVGNTPEAGTWAVKSDAAFDRALDIDDQNWGARFSKAVSLSNWPAFLGRGPEAIEHFEILLEQQAALPKRDEFVMTYMFLGNMYQAGGDMEEAVATWKAGLELFPNVEDLQRAIELAESSAETSEGRGR